jgi:hypothetical protein
MQLFPLLFHLHVNLVYPVKITTEYFEPKRKANISK